MIDGPDSPFGDDPIEELRLPRTPLVQVLAQVRFPPLMALMRQDKLAEFQEAIRGEYPVLRQERQTAILVSAEGVSTSPQEASDTLWRFSDLPGVWTITVASNFITLETKRYESRDDFFLRFERALSAFESRAKPVLYDRLGIRYVNQILDATWLTDLSQLVRPEVLGLIAGPPGPAGFAGVMAQSVAQYQLAEGVLLARSALLPPRTTYDPSVQPVDTASWWLDLDMSEQAVPPREFRVPELVGLGRDFATAVYRYFRWSVTPELLRRAGAEL